MSDSGVRVIPLPVLEDNYSYLIVDIASNFAFVVDPAEPKKVLEAVEKENVKIKGILTTHHHWDHAGGNNELLSLIAEKVPVYGGEEKVQGLTNSVGADDQIDFENIHIRVLSTPCHTAGHVLYYLDTGAETFLFTGDTLFIGGCGRFFEGTPQQMVNAMKQISNLPATTKIMCGHEYTVANLTFASRVDSQNDILLAKLAWAKEMRERGEFTIPSTVGEEQAYNPFMRVHLPVIKDAVCLPNGTEDEVMGALRSYKNKGKL